MIEFHYNIVAYIDILGFSEMIKEDSKTKCPDNLNKIIKTFGLVKEKNETSIISTQVFSDSIIFTAPLSSDGFIECVQTIISLQYNFLTNLILLRGALAFGHHYQDPQILYSEALVHAYETEINLARFPRIVIENNLWDWFINNNSINRESKGLVSEQIVKDSDGQRFLNYLVPGMLINQKAHILQCIENAPVTQPSVLEKYQWLVRYFNFIAINSGKSDIQINKIQTDFVIGA
jgi:hypothetical protein